MMEPKSFKIIKTCWNCKHKAGWSNHFLSGYDCGLHDITIYDDSVCDDHDPDVAYRMRVR